MAVGDTAAHEQRVQRVDPEALPADVQVRHFDELTTRKQERIAAAARDLPQRATDLPSGPRDGEVVVFTEYLYVQFDDI